MGNRCLTRKAQRLWHIAPSYNQAMEGWRKYGEIFPQGIIVRSKSPLRVEFPSTGSEVEFKTTAGRAYEHWRSAGLNGAGFDEAGTIPEDAFLTLQPMLTDDPTSFQALVGSPRGRNWFHKKWLLGHDRASGWWSNPFTWPSFLRPSFHRSEWERMKLEYPAIWFRQEFMAEFLSNVQGAFQRSVASPHEYMTIDELREFAKIHEVFIGVDFARKVDWTVIAVMDRSGRVVYLERFQLKPWPYTIDRCVAVQRACSGAQMAIDASGIGDVAHSMLLEHGADAGAIYPYVFTQESKAELFVTGQRLNDGGKIRIPETDTIACHEFEACEVDVNSNGHLKFGAPQGEHDDVVVAVLLALWLGNRNARFDLGRFKHYEPAISA